MNTYRAISKFSAKYFKYGRDHKANWFFWSNLYLKNLFTKLNIKAIIKTLKNENGDLLV